MRMSRRAAAWSAAAAVLLFAGSAFVVSAEDPTGTVLVPTVPERVLDTRQAGQVTTLGPDTTDTFSFTGLVPAGAKAVDINVTIVDGTQASFLALWPTGGDRPIVSAVNWTSPKADANSIAVQLGTNQSIDLFNKFGTVNVILDLMGYYIDAPSEPGPPGPAGSPGIADIETVSNTANFGANTPSSVTATCSAGKSVLSGGFSVENFDPLTGSLTSAPTGDLSGWQLVGTSTVTQNVTAFAVCATVATTS